MRNNNRRRLRGICAALLLLALVLAGCGGKSTGTKHGGMLPPASAGRETDTVPATQPPEADPGLTAEDSLSEAARASLSSLRAAMEGTPLLFAVAYLGRVEAAQARPAQWVKDLNPQLAADYPFLAELPPTQCVGYAGALFCIVPRDPQASLAISRLGGAGGSSDGEVLYRSEAGAPVLLLCEQADGADVQITVVGSSGQVSWQPALDEAEFICLPAGENGEFLALDFTGYAPAPTRLSDLLVLGWQTPASETLQGTAWSIQSYPGDTLPAISLLELRGGQAALGDYAGEASLRWYYEDDGNDQELYEGWWRLEEADGQLCLRLDLLCVGGALLPEDGTPPHISDLFPLLWDAQQETLALGKGTQNGTLLPFHSAQQSFECLTRSVG